ncbi:3-dehydroquinate dehydratase [Candidatus Scalindua japonica]|uniref:3-dehydroquinate dehydratase n=1 Tax=Candidatus Scalindua japonica TaxID=1284222 RepID=A0A286U0B7_9BACT|nr:hypothetical protein [Candidatus Scalindua japonica]GAX61564.1 3-dehydroquinate dehydratase [Candidatus Scalindua japonica]
MDLWKLFEKQLRKEAEAADDFIRAIKTMYGRTELSDFSQLKASDLRDSLEHVHGTKRRSKPIHMKIKDAGHILRCAKEVMKHSGTIEKSSLRPKKPKVPQIIQDLAKIGLPRTLAAKLKRSKINTFSDIRHIASAQKLAKKLNITNAQAKTLSNHAHLDLVSNDPVARKKLIQKGYISMEKLARTPISRLKSALPDVKLKEIEKIKAKARRARAYSPDLCHGCFSKGK